MIAESIYHKNRQTVYNLFKSGRCDINIIVLLLCESHFRKSIDRQIEYMAMPILFLLWKKRFEILSVGIGQIQLRYWIKIQKKQSPISYSSFRKYCSVYENYDLIKSRIKENLGNNFSDSQLIAFHTGETRKYHYNLFKELKIITKLHLIKYNEFMANAVA